MDSSNETSDENAATQQPRQSHLPNDEDPAGIKSPTTSVKQLLADTNAAPPAHRVTFAAKEDDNNIRKRRSQVLDSEGLETTTADHAQGNPLSAGQKLKRDGRALLSSSSSDSHTKPTFNQTLADLRQFLMPFLKLLPFQGAIAYLKRFVAPIVRFWVRIVAKVLHRWDFGLASNIMYDLHLALWRWIINLFFREIRPRGAWRVPRQGAVLFVCGPHHNQFLDPLLLMSEVRMSASRRVSFLIAEKSYHRSFIGLAGRIAHSIPVARAADNAKTGKGRIYLPTITDDETIIKGKGTQFTKESVQKGQLQLGKPYAFATVEIVDIIDDTTIKVKKMFQDKGERDLKAEGEKLEKGQDGAGLAYKCLPYIDQTKMYSSVYKKLSDGGCIGIFPEGGSHDRTDFLPLKHGLAIMALGAMAANPDLRVQIVPVGLNYFHPDKFRSRAVIEFGAPIAIPTELVGTFSQGGQGKRDAIGSIMDLVYDGLKSVTVRAPDYETLMVIQASRRLYKPPGQQLNLSQVVELNKRFIVGYNAYRDEPRVQALYKQVQAYNTSLRRLGLKDHQVEGVGRPVWRSLLTLLWRTGLISAWTIMALPGIILNAPIFITASSISRKKAKEAVAASTVKLQGRDVLATWKVLVSLGMAPILYGIYTAIAMYCVFRYNLGRKYLILTPLFMLIAVPSFGYSALRFGEVGMDIYKSLPPLFLSLFPWRKTQLERLRQQRRVITEELTGTIEEFAPKLWADFESHRMIPSSDASHDSQPGTPTSRPNRRRKSSYGADSSILQHPMSWIDEKLFGWSTKGGRRRKGTNEEGIPVYTPSASQPATPGYNESEDDRADYDEVVRAVEERLNEVGAGDSPSKRLQRRSSSKSRSQLNLTELVPNDGMSTAVAGGAAGDVEQRRASRHIEKETADN